MTGSREVAFGDRFYRFEEQSLEDQPSPGWAHHGLALLADGSLVACAPDHAQLVFLDRDGRKTAAMDLDLVELHGLRVVGEGASVLVYAADNGHKFTPAVPRYAELRRPGRVVALGLDGALHLELLAPEIEAYEQRSWSPCAVAVDDVAQGGSGDIFVADGYGESLLHRYAGDGTWRSTEDGSSTGTNFATPHDVIIDRRRNPPELLVADRSNRRLVVFDLDGRFLRTIGADVLSSPSALAVVGDLLIVAELHGRLVAFDAADAFLGELGANDDHERPGWPNALDDAGRTVAVDDHGSKHFNSPHGLAVDPSGVIYVAEWRIGGRLVKLTPV